MGKSETNFDWMDRIQFEGRPAYAAILAPLEDAIKSGELQAGDRLPAQRHLAEKLGVDLTMVTRAYSAARARGLVEGTVGRGTFVRAQSGAGLGAMVDLAHANPPLSGFAFGAQIAETTAAILKTTDYASLMSYQAYHVGGAHETEMAARWLEPFIGAVAPTQIVLSPGAQAALAATLSAICQPGDAIVAEPLTHAGFIWVARKFGLRILPCPVDAKGFVPDALERICKTERPKAIYVVPTHNNPTSTTMPLDRRRAVAKIAAAADALIVEADPFSPYLEAPLPAIASLAPERTFYIGTLSKCLGAGLRLGFVVPPEAWMSQIVTSLRTVAYGAPKLVSAIFARWVEDGVAARLMTQIRAETRARRQIAAALLPQAIGGPEAAHLWIPLASSRVSERLALLAREHRIEIVTEEGYAVEAGSPAGVRLSLGSVADQSGLERALTTIGQLLPKAMPSAPPLVL